MRVVQQEIQKADGARILVVKVVDADPHIDSAVIKKAIEGRLESLGNSGNDVNATGVAKEGGYETIELSPRQAGNGSADVDSVEVEMKNVKMREFLDGDMNRVIERSIDVRVASNSSGDVNSSGAKLAQLQPPKSIFQRLQPSRDRYTFSKDEL